MNLRQIECALAVAQDLSFSKAARNLYLSQSVVSQNVSALEDYLGTRLFLRNRRNVALTPAGEYFCRRMIEAKRSFDEVEQKTKEIGRGDGAAVSLGYDGPMAEAWIGRALGMLHNLQPEVTVHIRKETVSYLTDLLMDGSIDIAITHNFEIEGLSEITFKPLMKSQCRIFLPVHHPLANQDKVSIADLRNETILVDCRPNPDGSPTRTAEALRQAGLNFDRAHYVSNGDVIFSMVEAGMGCFLGGSFCADYASHFEVRCVETDIAVPDILLGLAWRANEKPACASLLASCAKHIFK